jgi:hypothetical protein
MSEQEIKARELVIKFQYQNNPPLMFDVAKNCAIINIDLQIEELERLDEKWHKPEDISMTSFFQYEIEDLKEILEIVKKL